MYARQHDTSAPGPASVKRGPKPAVSDETLHEASRTGLVASPFKGEGNGKVWARQKFGKGIRLSRKRVLRLMLENNLISPYRRPQGEPKDHDGTIGTNAPHIMWGTDATKVFTAEEGYGWIFVAVEHWNAVCMGVPICKKAERMAALEPVARGCRLSLGPWRAAVVRGLARRMDHGSQNTSDHFQNQIKAWSSVPSFAFVQEPETNKVYAPFLYFLRV